MVINHDPKWIHRNMVLNAILIHGLQEKLNKILLDGQVGFRNMSAQDLVQAAKDILPAEQLTALLPSLAILESVASNGNPPRDGDKFFSVLVTRDAGTESAEVYVYAKNKKEAEKEALTLVNENEITMTPDEGNESEDAYLCDADCVQFVLIEELV